ncbi:MAG TPA: CusA/CzcA family heavy metal efflux RND transporter [Verrucomicrobiota bacterium]|nr:efflux RND transporter permease subunit [Verrucomicrobiota bacterium]HRR65660.1 CusA/CzcA family heavy metal efflux RND transporter [Candidatus Paceibacterota bacterium]HNR70909.1 CusA/CzcA family heavy metal efflux RND transporter [Verrucomicrobiota bacterium]HNS69999.1 CusA/CzcA family heavy metal efflux RND transporter [Verrucomicrobiota bacterium]HOF71932.1 CusA/CzcA family heavy metal efflux RND transporter [Verrucomicrobiota bacterium]
MLNWLVQTSLRNRLLVCVLTLALVVVGGRLLRVLPIDAFPDTTPVQVQINANVPALSPQEAEQQVTIPVELALGGLPGLQNVRSISKFGLSQVVATFDDRTSIYRARQLISERLQSVDLPAGVPRPQLGPIATGLGEVFHYAVRAKDARRTLTELRELQDWVIKPELRKVPGVAEITSWGGFEKQYHVVADPDLLVKHRLTWEDLFAALEANNQNVGGGQVVRAGESLLVQGIGLTTNVAEIGDIVIASTGGVPVHVRDVATVQVDHEIRRGAVTGGGRGEMVLGLGFMLMGENSHVVTRALKARLAEVRKMLPDDIQLEVLYDRTELVDNVIRTVEHNLLAGALLVIAVLFAFLGNLRAGLVVAAAIPLSMLFAGSLMLQAGISASLLSLGAMDFGLLVDGSVVMVENAMRGLARRRQELGRSLTRRERQEVLARAPLEVVRPVAFGVGIILIVFLPILTLEGVEGKLFRPMALTMVFALAGSLLLALTFIPVAASLFLLRPIKEKEPWLERLARRLYEPVLNLALRFRWFTLLGALGLLAGAGVLAARMGGEFLPRLGEGAIVGTSVRVAGVSVEEAAALNDRLEKLLLAGFPDEIANIWTRLGSADVATDPMGVELSDFFLALKPRAQWTKARTQAGLVEEMQKVFARVPGLRVAISQPIEMRMNELVAGIRSDIGIKIYGDDLEILRGLSDEVQRVLADIPGRGEVTGEQLVGQPVLQVRVDPRATERFGVPARNVLNVVEAVGSRKVGEIREGQRRFPLVVRLPDRQRTDPEALANTHIPTATGSVLPLKQLAQVVETEGPATINREWGRRRITVQCNVRGRDVGSFVAEAQDQIARRVKLPEGYQIEWGGQFENMQRANARLRFVVPLALALILALLYFSLGSMRDVLIVATGIPLGAIGGVAALWVRGMPFTVSAAIGFIALSGVAILNGLVLVTFIRQRLDAGRPLANAVREGCLVRLRPVLMTALVAAVGFIPMAVNVGIGGEVQRPLATVVIGGALSNTLLTLIVLPVLYCWFHPRQPAADGSP